ncbi:hypothetical protein GN244_ATG07050 [Phytophthora infestans]|uniref:Uncharacterized protein n=1 Tax=Phytophthora infestans TaxID=4787 RepID=A0A833WLC8_PHYIN|nr:hypothetical protein GN244_ATG07050 [Phytophthora infestans]
MDTPTSQTKIGRVFSNQCSSFHIQRHDHVEAILPAGKVEQRHVGFAGSTSYMLAKYPANGLQMAPVGKSALNPLSNGVS